MQLVEKAVQDQNITFISYKEPFSFIVFPTSHTPTGLFWQKGQLLWLHLPTSPQKILTPYVSWVAKLLQLAREQSVKIFGKEPDKIILPYSSAQISWLMQNDDEWTISLVAFSGILDNHYSADRLLQFFKVHPIIFSRRTSPHPLDDAI